MAFVFLNATNVVVRATRTDIIIWGVVVSGAILRSASACVDISSLAISTIHVIAGGRYASRASLLFALIVAPAV